MQLFIFIFCVVGCGLSSYFLGRQLGVSSCIDYLIEAGLIDIDTEE